MTKITRYHDGGRLGDERYFLEEWACRHLDFALVSNLFQTTLCIRTASPNLTPTLFLYIAAYVEKGWTPT
jgi:hypothetical protein